MRPAFDYPLLCICKRQPKKEWVFDWNLCHYLLGLRTLVALFTMGKKQDDDLDTKHPRAGQNDGKEVYDETANQERLSLLAVKMAEIDKQYKRCLSHPRFAQPALPPSQKHLLIGCALWTSHKFAHPLAHPFAFVVSRRIPGESRSARTDTMSSRPP